MAGFYSPSNVSVCGVPYTQTHAFYARMHIYYLHIHAYWVVMSDIFLAKRQKIQERHSPT